MSPPTVAARSDGAQARERLLYAALRLFAAGGFDRTSVRDIARAAGANVSAVGYYFGDKAGLYRAAFFEPLGEQCQGAMPEPGTVPLPELMHGFFRELLTPLKQGEATRLLLEDLRKEAAVKILLPAPPVAAPVTATTPPVSAPPVPPSPAAPAKK